MKPLPSCETRTEGLGIGEQCRRHSITRSRGSFSWGEDVWLQCVGMVGRCGCVTFASKGSCTHSHSAWGYIGTHWNQGGVVSQCEFSLADRYFHFNVQKIPRLPTFKRSHIILFTSATVLSEFPNFFEWWEALNWMNVLYVHTVYTNESMYFSQMIVSHHIMACVFFLPSLPNDWNIHTIMTLCGSFYGLQELFFCSDIKSSTLHFYPQWICWTMI